MRDIQGHLSATDMQYWIMLLHNYVLIPNGRWLAEIKLVIRGQVLRHMQNRVMQYLYNWHFVQFWNPFANAPPLWLENVALDQDIKWLLAFCHLLLDCCWTLDLFCSFSMSETCLSATHAWTCLLRTFQPFGVCGDLLASGLIVKKFNTIQCDKLCL